MIIDNDHERVGKWICEKLDTKWREGNKCIGLERNGEIVAGVMFDWTNGASVTAHIAITGQINREFLWFVFYYPFEQLKVNVILGQVSSKNLKAQRFDEHLGFQLHTIIPSGCPDGDLFIYSMYKHQCKWLRIKNGNVQQARRAAIS